MKVAHNKCKEDSGVVGEIAMTSFQELLWLGVGATALAGEVFSKSRVGTAAGALGASLEAGAAAAGAGAAGLGSEAISRSSRAGWTGAVLGGGAEVSGRPSWSPVPFPEDSIGSCKAFTNASSMETPRLASKLLHASDFSAPASEELSPAAFKSIWSSSSGMSSTQVSFSGDFFLPGRLTGERPS